MKKLLIIFFLLQVSLALAVPQLPFILGHEIVIDGEPAKNIEISLQNSETFEILKTKTNERGKYLIDLSNFKKGFFIGDVINLTIFWKGEYRSYPIIIEGEGGKFDKLDITWEKIEPIISIKSEGCIDALTLSKELQKQKEEIINASNIEANKRIKTERILSVGIALLFLVISALVTRYYSIKYSKGGYKK